MGLKLVLPGALLVAIVGLAAIAPTPGGRELPEPTPTPAARADRLAPLEVPRAADPRQTKPARGPIAWRDSAALGTPAAGSLVNGVKLPPAGRHYFTWDPVQRESPSAPWRRWGTDDLIHTLLGVIHDFARAHPGAPRLGIGDLSLPEGGDFGPEVSRGIGHATHQNGLDVDVYYPLRSGRERAPLEVKEIHLRLAQDLVDRFVAAGAEVVYVGPSTPLTGPVGIVVPLVNHDNHLHVRIAP